MGAWRENEFQDMLTEWESIIEERESSSHEQVPDSIKSLVLAERAQNALYEHVRLTAEELDACKKIMQCAVDFVVSKNHGRESSGEGQR